MLGYKTRDEWVNQDDIFERGIGLHEICVASNHSPSPICLLLPWIEKKNKKNRKKLCHGKDVVFEQRERELTVTSKYVTQEVKTAVSYFAFFWLE